MAGDNWYTLSQVKKVGVFGIEEELTNNITESRKYAPNSGHLLSIKASTQNVAYEWLSNGSLERRYDYTANIKDEFSYDAQDRLTTNESFVASTGASRRKVSHTYSNLGNLTLNASTVGGDNRATAYKYKTASNPRPHAVSEASINGVLTALNYNANGAITFYDAAGTTNDKHISYNSLNQPTVINVGGASISDTNYRARDEFRYAPDGQRYYRRSSFADAGVMRTEHTYYANGYELIVYDSASPLLTSSRIQIGKLQIVQNTPKTGGVATIQNTLLVDHQGSVTGIVRSGASATNMAYEAFGLRRSPTWLTNITSAEFTSASSKLDMPITNGYTGHEMLDRTGFIHMNGRVYDPLLGRFLSPDPIVQAPGNSQSWNRYSYGFNNPLRYTDPSGYSSVEESPPAIGVRCGEACQRKGQSDAFFYMVQTASSRGGVWESYGNNLYNTATTQGALMMEMAKGMAISNAYLKIVVNGGGSKTSTNNVLGALSQSQINQMYPMDVVKYWAAGNGGDLYFGPDSRVAQIFSQGNGASQFREYLLNKYEGSPPNLAAVTRFSYKFTWARAFKTLNSAEQVVGSWEGGAAGVIGDKILFSVRNTMGANSLFFGRQLGELGIVPVGAHSSDLRMTIEWQDTISRGNAR